MIPTNKAEKIDKEQPDTAGKPPFGDTFFLHRQSDVFVVVPVYNEVRVIAQTLTDLLVTDYQVVVVDDGSKDGTWYEVTRLPVYALQHPVNLGQGAALQTGTIFALIQGAEIIVHFDADGQHRVADIPALIAPLRQGSADLALGSRFLRPEDIQAIPPARRILLRLACLVNGVMTGVWLSDAHNGLRALTREAASKIHLRENRFAHASELLAQVQKGRLRYVEVPTRVVYSDYSRAKGQSAWNAVNIFIDMILQKISK